MRYCSLTHANHHTSHNVSLIFHTLQQLLPCFQTQVPFHAMTLSPRILHCHYIVTYINNVADPTPPLELRTYPWLESITVIDNISSVHKENSSVHCAKVWQAALNACNQIAKFAT